MDKSKSQLKREAVMSEVNKPSTIVDVDQPKVNKPTHRYFCDSCTGIAGVSNIPEAVAQITCERCGKTQMCKKGNWIKI